MYSLSSEKKRCISFKMATLMWYVAFFLFTRTVLNCLDFKSYYVSLCY